MGENRSQIPEDSQANLVLTEITLGTILAGE